MALTHKSMEAQKKVPIIRKPENPARRFMSRDQALEDNAKRKAIAEKLEKERIRLEQEAGIGTDSKDDKEEKKTEESTGKTGERGRKPKEKKTE